jgi:hypothetical protein
MRADQRLRQIEAALLAPKLPDQRDISQTKGSHQSGYLDLFCPLAITGISILANYPGVLFDLLGILLSYS